MRILFSLLPYIELFKIKDKKERYAAHAFGNNKLESIERNLSKTFLLRKQGSVQRLEFN